MKNLSTAAKTGVFLLLFAFLLVSASASIAQQTQGSTASGAAAASKGGTKGGVAAAGAAGTGGTVGISATTVVGVLAGLGILVGVLAAASSGDDGAGTTTQHP